MMAFEVRATLLHEPMRDSGRQLFIDTITGVNGPDVGQRMAGDLQTTIESAFNSKGQASSAMHLSRMQGYIETMVSTLAGLHAAGVAFHAIETEDGRPGLRIELHPARQEEPQPKAKASEPPADLDSLDGADYEAALAKMTPAERAAHLKQD